MMPPTGFADSNQTRLDIALRLFEEIAREMADRQADGTVGVELSVKDGRFGRPKRIRVDYH